MNYFELFSLPVSLKIDTAQLQKTYYRLCREFHPDHAATDAQEQAMHQTADIHKARETLSKPELRLAYLLKINGMMEEDEKYKLPASFLGQMMDINEAAMELSGSPDDVATQALQQDIEQCHATIYQPVAAYFTADELTLTAQDLSALQLYYYQQKYLQRVQDSIEKTK
ncbi:MAG TPA: Fe-S protein assembly co-chaperone HscB [Chitinophagaceae bacterium]|nr:Fe-S protein assembly co-chaperone HscB [Chitinophagaceae bacterium]